MFTFFVTAARFRDLVAIVTLTWRAALPAGQHLSTEAPIVADAIATAVLSEESPYDAETTAALLGEFAFRESGVRAHPCLRSKSPTCGDSGMAHGYWQLHQPSGEETAERQAASWLALLRQSAALCPELPLAMIASGYCDKGTHIAAARLRAAQAAVNTWRASQKAERSSASAPDPAATLPATAVATAAEARP